MKEDLEESADDSDSDYVPSDVSSDSSSESSDTATELDLSKSREARNIQQDNTGDVEQWSFDITAERQKQLVWRELQRDDFMPVNREPIDIYRLFVDQELVEKMVHATNLYARNLVAQSTLSSSARAQNWTDTNVNEMYAFIGLMMWMGLVSMPTIASYWQRSTLYQNTVAPTTMTRNRFQLLLRMWHFTNDDDEQDRLHKIRSFLQLLVQKFAAVRCPGENIVVDESMIPFRGRLKFRQYMPGRHINMVLNYLSYVILLATLTISKFMRARK